MNRFGRLSARKKGLESGMEISDNNLRNLVFGRFGELIPEIDSLEREVSEGKEDGELRYLLGESYLEMDDFRSARMHLEQAAESTNPQIRYLSLSGLGLLEFAQENYKTAAEYMMIAVAIAEKESLYEEELFRIIDHLAVVELLQKGGKYDEARTYLQERGIIRESAEEMIEQL
jgi:tetratricopeptide (TPR) repeat protein